MGAERPLALLWSAGKWQQFSPSHIASYFNSLVPDGSGGLWVAYQGPSGASAVARFAGGRWPSVVLPHVTGKRTSASVLMRLPRSATVFAIGSSFWGGQPSTAGLVLKYSR